MQDQEDVRRRRDSSAHNTDLRKTLTKAKKVQQSIWLATGVLVLERSITPHLGLAGSAGSAFSRSLVINPPRVSRHNRTWPNKSGAKHIRAQNFRF